MTGWAYKDITQDDLRFPLVYGEGKRSRLLATIGVTRGFGDHDLKAQSNGATPVYIKPFLTPQPEVRVLDIENETVTENDVLIMATDGLWDVVSNERVASIGIMIFLLLLYFYEKFTPKCFLPRNVMSDNVKIFCIKVRFFKNVLYKINSSKNLQKLPLQFLAVREGSFCNFF